MSELASSWRLAPAKLLRGLQRAAAPPAIARGALAPGVRRRRRLGVAALVAVVLGAGYMLWLRDSGLVAVEDVQVTGLTGRDAERVRTALDGAARGMTTLHVDRDALEAAAAAFPVIRAIEVEADFPSGLRITVIEHRPVAVLVSGEKRIPVAGDGSVLAELPTEGSLPEIHTGATIPASQLEPGFALDAARVAGGAPGALVGRLDQVERESDRGLVMSVEDGPDLIFGDTDRLTAKWAAAARVLADPGAAGAEYLDLRLPERPAAGGWAWRPWPPSRQSARARSKLLRCCPSPSRRRPSSPRRRCRNRPRRRTPCQAQSNRRRRRPPHPRHPPTRPAGPWPSLNRNLTVVPTLYLRSRVTQARFVAGSVDIPVEVHLQCGFTWSSAGW